MFCFYSCECSKLYCAYPFKLLNLNEEGEFNPNDFHAVTVHLYSLRKHTQQYILPLGHYAFVLVLLKQDEFLSE